jgi:hypothetical protein
MNNTAINFHNLFVSPSISNSDLLDTIATFNVFYFSLSSEFSISGMTFFFVIIIINLCCYIDTFLKNYTFSCTTLNAFPANSLFSATTAITCSANQRLKSSSLICF